MSQSTFKKENSLRKTPPALLHLRNVSLVRGGNLILKDISWTIQKGEHWFILGHNGSGKTSLLEIVMGYLWATTGEVEVLGEVYGKTYLPDHRKRIGYVAPWIAKHIKPEETVREVVAGGLEATIEYHKEMSQGVLTKIHSALKTMECLSFEDAPFTRLSSGEQLKVLIARALIKGPEILILDEPFSALDIGARHSIQKLVEKVGDGHHKASIIIVTHHFDDIAPFYTHGLILKKGQVVEMGAKSKVLQSSVLKKAFGLPIKLMCRNQRYSSH